MSWRNGSLWALVFGSWTFGGLVFLGQFWLATWVAGTPPLNFASVIGTLVNVWMWALLTPITFMACERFPLGRPWRPGNLGVHLVLWGLCCGAEAGQRELLALDPHPKPFLAVLLHGCFSSLISYLALIGIGHALRFYRLYGERRVHASQLETQLVRAQLLALQMQLRPHFLFNALNTITGLIRTGDSRGAVQMTAGLADLLRTVLRSDGTQEVPLSQELEFVEHYLRLEQLRFEERLRTRIHVDPEVTHALVPHLLLQPLVENAVRHGSRGGTAENQVDITVTREADMLWLRVRDTGKGPPPHESAAPEPGVPQEGGIGLANTRARLRHLYGDAQRLELLPAQGGGTLAQVAIPFRHAAQGSRP